MFHWKKSSEENRSEVKGAGANHSILYDSILGVELALYSGIGISAVQFLPGYLTTGCGFFLAGAVGYIVWITKGEVGDFLVKIPLWVHAVTIGIMLGIFVFKEWIFAKLASLFPTN